MDQLNEIVKSQMEVLTPEEQDQARKNIIKFAQQNNYSYEVDKSCVIIMVPSFKVKE